VALINWHRAPVLKLHLPDLAVNMAVAGFFLWFGIHRFRKTEKSFADLI
jgi:lipopolysaccharide transport system permease protein